MTYQYNTYKTVSHMDRKTRQVVMLYDGAIRFCQQAKDAIEKKNIQERYNSITKACDIITGLQLCLDFESGGNVAKLLYDYYAGLDMRLMMVHSNNDVKLVDSCIDNLKVMRDAWLEVDEKSTGYEENEPELGTTGLGYIPDNEDLEQAGQLTYGSKLASGSGGSSYYPASLASLIPNLSATA
jgi:flagellar secretion chaperone FliS